MHLFSELAARGAAMAADNAREAGDYLLAELEKSGTTVLVKALQAVELQRAMTTVGLVSMFEASLQDALDADDGFKAALDILKDDRYVDLGQRFSDLLMATNVLKHGTGRSYEDLLKRRETLPFRVRAEDEFFEEGDVSGLHFLIKADEEFLAYSAALVEEVTTQVRISKPNLIL